MNKTLSGKTISFLGDSITAFHVYQYQVQELVHAAAVNNYGVPGSAIGSSDETSFTARASQIAPESDLVFVFGATNDFHYNIPLGQMSDAAASGSFFAGTKLLIELLKKQCPKADLIFATPLQRVMEAENGHDGINALGLELKQYVGAMLEVCEACGVPVVDLFHHSRITVSTAAAYLSDGLHPNEIGLSVLAEDIAEGLNAIYDSKSI